MVGNKILDGARCFGWFIVIVTFIRKFYERVQFRNYPAVYFRALLQRNFFLLKREAIYVCIQCKKCIRIIKRREKFSLSFFNSLLVEFKIVPRLRIGKHV